MSYSILEARGEFTEQLNRAVVEDDSITLFKMASRYAEEDPEYADQLLKLARKAQRNEWSYDEHVDNEITLNGVNV